MLSVQSVVVFPEAGGRPARRRLHSRLFIFSDPAGEKLAFRPAALPV
jgi:hypothetical protein